MARTINGNGYVTFNPKIGPEPSIRKKYSNHKQYNFIIEGKGYTATSNHKGIVVFCSPILKEFKNKHIDELLLAHPNNKKVADEKEELWNL
jgi:hypothetical protein